MKKILITLSLFLFTAAIHAQDSEKKVLSKEKKAELKKMKEEHLASSFKDAGISDEHVRLAREVLEMANKKSNELKSNSTLTDAEKDVKKKEINEEKNAKLKEILGDKYKAWSEIRKKQKAEEEAFTAAQ